MKEMYGVKIRLRDDGLWYWREWFDTSDEAVSLLEDAKNDPAFVEGKIVKRSWQDTVVRYWSRQNGVAKQHEM